MNRRVLQTGFLAVFLVSVMWIYGCGDSTTARDADSLPSRPEPPYDWADPQIGLRLGEALDRWAEDFGLHGAAAAVLTPGWLDWSGSTGVMDVDTNEPYARDTVGRIASATKSFTSTVILQLVDEGLLSLDTTLAQFVPEYPNGEHITVEHLLRHRSGIPEIQLADGFYILAVLLRPHRWVMPREILEWTYLPIPILDIRTGALVPRQPVTEPGGEFHYSQPGYIALGIMIEEVAGKALADTYKERIFVPLGMTETYLPRLDDPFDAWGYTNLFGLLEEKVPSTSLVSSANGLNSSGWSAGGIISTARQLITFLSAMLEGRLFSEEGLANATDWMEIEPGDVVESGEYGLGLFRNQYEGYTTVGHDGALPGAGSVMQYIPGLDVYVGAVTNTDRDYVAAPDLVERVRRALLNLDQDDE